jgi:hypothetical protein
VAEDEPAQFRLALQNAKEDEIFTGFRLLQPKPIAEISLDTDVVERGEKPVVTVTLAVSKASAQDYAVQFDVRTRQGAQVSRRACPPSPRTRLEEALDLSAAPSGTERLVIGTMVTNVRTGQVVFQGKTPLHIIGSPWAQERPEGH